MTGTTNLVEGAVQARLPSGIASASALDLEAKAPAPRASVPQTADLEELVQSLIARYGHLGDQVVTMRRPLLDLGVDILALVDIVMDVETRFAIELDPDEILSWLTAADVVETLENALRA
jgi:acyl carrier protein